MRYIKFAWFHLPLILLLILTMTFPGKSTVQAAQSGGTGGAGKAPAATNTDKAWDRSSATAIALSGDTARISGGGAVFSGGTLTIRQAGAYVLSGKLENGRVLINAGKNDVVRLVLNGVSLHNETGPAIHAPKSKELVLILEKETRNTVSDGSRYTASKDGDESGNEPDAAIFVRNGLTITGDGSLAVTGKKRHGIRAQDILTIAGGVISVDSAGDALRGRDGVVIQGGNFTLKAGGDAIQSNNDKDDAKGFVNITGGAFAIQSGNDGIQARNTLTITGGTFQITTGGGSAGAPARMDDFRGGWGGGFGGGRGGGWGSASKPSAGESVSKKALKAGKLISVAGGDLTIDAEDDALHSNGKIVISSGKLTIKTGDDGIHADAALEISGGEINIASSYEGLEGLSITISGGNVTVNSSDDAINAADGGENNTFGGFGGPMMGMGGRVSVNEKIFVRISGGTLDVYAGHDGIDANGNIFIEGGTTRISGPSTWGEGAIDFDGNFIVTGGKIITAGSVLGVSQDSTQPFIFVSYSGQQPSGSVIAVKDSTGKALLEYTSKTSYTLSGFTSPSFKTGETYSLFINGEKRTDIKLSAIITRIGDNGGAYTGDRGFGGFGDRGFGGFGGGGFGGFGGPPPGGPGGGRGGGQPRWR